MISEEGITPDEKKIEAIKFLPVPTVLGKSVHLLECGHTIEGLYRTSLR